MKWLPHGAVFVPPGTTKYRAREGEREETEIKTEIEKAAALTEKRQRVT